MLFSRLRTLGRRQYIEPFFLCIHTFFLSSLSRFSPVCWYVYLQSVRLFFGFFFSIFAPCTSSMIFSWMKINVLRLSVHTENINPISMQNLYIYKYVCWWTCLAHRHPKHSIGNWNVWWYYQSRSHGVYLINSVMCSRVRLNTQNTATPPLYLSVNVCINARARTRTNGSNGKEILTWMHFHSTCN